MAVTDGCGILDIVWSHFPLSARTLQSISHVPSMAVHMIHDAGQEV